MEEVYVKIRKGINEINILLLLVAPQLTVFLFVTDIQIGHKKLN